MDGVTTLVVVVVGFFAGAQAACTSCNAPLILSNVISIVNSNPSLIGVGATGPTGPRGPSEPPDT